MRTRTVISWLTVALTLLATVIIATSCVVKKDADLVIYAYDSFTSEWGPGPVVIPAFEKATGISVHLVAPGDAGNVLARVIDERAAPVADVVVGIDNNLLSKALEAGVLSAYRPKQYKSIPANLVLDQKWRVTPYDWSSFAIMMDTEKLQNPPLSLEDLTKPEYKNKLILMDPRTSTPGLGFLAWTLSVYGDSLGEYWSRLRPSILTMSPGWDTGYGLFTSGEAPLVISYTTSAAYHAEYETAGRYKALEFNEGHPVQIEGAGIVAGTKNREAAEAFIDFMLTDEFQSALPLTNWMYPVSPSVELPASYAYAPKPASTVSVDPALLDEAVQTALNALQAP
ncbi:MAG: thiamine ABC transporter substrate-binding protein [Spirochaetales bacterium]|nr:thiamine ABC transporter substrate-binding protein [Spirochaetales bacterium]